MPAALPTDDFLPCPALLPLRSSLLVPLVEELSVRKAQADGDVASTACSISTSASLPRFPTDRTGSRLLEWRLVVEGGAVGVAVGVGAEWADDGEPLWAAVGW